MLQLASPLLQRFHADWESRRRGRAFPARQDYDPCDIAYALGSVSLIDVFYDPLRFRFRVHGTGIAERTGRELTEKFVHEMTDLRHREMAESHFRQVVETRAPVATVRRAYVTEVRVWNCEVLVMPLSSNGTDIDMMISCIDWDEADAQNPALAPVETDGQP